MILVIPPVDEPDWPSLGPLVWRWITDHLCYGPGDLLGDPIKMDEEWYAIICRAYQVWPQGHEWAGRRRFKRVAISRRKGRAKTELAAWIAAAELHPRAPVRTRGWYANGQPKGGSVRDPYIPLVAYTEEQTVTTVWGALYEMISRSPVAKDFDIGRDRIKRLDGSGGTVEPLAAEPNARDGARTTFQVFEEALAIDTPLPTATGWTTMAELRPGDEVLGSSGSAVRVLGCSPVHAGRQCYRVTFRDGTALVCDGEHLWSVRDRSHRGLDRTAWRTVRTREIPTMGLRYGNSGSPMWRWAVPVQRPAVGVTADLPVEPYALGVWLGDGERAAGCISTHIADIPHWREQLPTFNVLDDRGETVRFIPTGLRGRLRKAGILGRKQIPAAYMRAAAAQRLALLQGLFDTDGHVGRTGHATFSQTDTALTRQATELLRLSGYRPRAKFIPDPRSRAGGYWKVTAHARSDVPLFRMARKAQRVGRTVPRRVAEELAIVSIVPVESVPVRCIAVDAPDHLYQAGEGMILTHNTHRWYTPRLKRAYQTMSLNIPKRRTADAWSLEVTTAYCPGEGSIAEATMEHARSVAEGRAKDTRLFFSHRQAPDSADISTPEGLRAAVIEASGDVAAGWSDIDAICSQFDDPNLDHANLCRLYLNQIKRATDRAFDLALWNERAIERGRPPKDSIITLGFDGARSDDSTAIVGTEVTTGYQFLLGLWERPPNVEQWEVPLSEVVAVLEDAFATFKVWRLYADPPYWETPVNEWAGRWGDKVVIKWYTNLYRKVSYAVRAFAGAIADGSLTHDGSPDLARHVGNAYRRQLQQRDDHGAPLWVVQKEAPMSPFKIDAAMAAVLSWQARLDALAEGVGQPVPAQDYSVAWV